VAQSGDGARLVGLILLSTGSIVGAFVMVLESRHVIKTVNDVLIRSNDIHLEFFPSMLLSWRYDDFSRKMFLRWRGWRGALFPDRQQAPLHQAHPEHFPTAL
jgi:hypothetical protein